MKKIKQGSLAMMNGIVFHSFGGQGKSLGAVAWGAEYSRMMN